MKQKSQVRAFENGGNNAYKQRKSAETTNILIFDKFI